MMPTPGTWELLVSQLMLASCSQGRLHLDHARQALKTSRNSHSAQLPGHQHTLTHTTGSQGWAPANTLLLGS